MNVEHNGAELPNRQELFDSLGKFPLLSAIFGRRARRFGLGMTIPDGPLAFQSAHAPLPLSDTERMILVLAGAGVSGWNFGLPHTTTGAPNTGCNYPMRLVGRTYASAAGIHASELLWTDDSGTYITQFRELEPDAQQDLLQTSDLDALIDKARRHIVQLSSQRVVVPKEFPHIESHNFWVANQPGSTLFIPIVDLTQQVPGGAGHLAGRTRRSLRLAARAPLRRFGPLYPPRHVGSRASLSVERHRAVLAEHCRGGSDDCEP